MVYETDGAMNAFINVHSGVKPPTRFEGILTFFTPSGIARVFIKPSKRFGGYIMKCSKKTYDAFVELVHGKLKPMLRFVEMPFHDTFIGEPDQLPVVPKGAEEEPDLTPRVFPPGLGAVTVKEIIKYSKVPLSIELNKKRIFTRYQQDPNTSDAIYQHINTDEFLKQFAVPQLCYHSNNIDEAIFLVGNSTLPAGVTWPCTPEMFEPWTDEKRTFLKARPYRLLNLSIKRVGKKYHVTPHTVDSYLQNTVYCEQANGIPTHIHPDIVQFFIESSLRTNTLLPEEERMILVDLYLHRDRASSDEYSFLWHCDGSRKYECNAKDTVPVPGAENVDFLSLLMIMDKGMVAKSTSMISNIKSDRDASAEFSSTGRCKSVFTVSVTAGTTLCISDMDYFHSTPCAGITKKMRHETDQMMGYPETVEEKISLAPTLLSMSLNDEVQDMLKRDSRCFVRCHFISSSRITYQQSGEPFVIHPDTVEFTKGKVVKIQDISQLNAVLMHPFNAPFEVEGVHAPYGFKLGGRKRKTKRKQVK
jgi:hypothetical protein